jgi:hypothetical protein
MDYNNKINYLPILKTRDAELRGISKVSTEIKSFITPLFELTKSRKTKSFPEGPIKKRLEKIASDYGKTPFSLDLTSFTDLKNPEIENLYHHRNGFGNWVTFIRDLKESDFPDIIPVLLISEKDINTEDEYIQRHKREINSLAGSCDTFIYRSSSENDGFEFDLNNLFDQSCPLIILLDMGYIRKDRWQTYASKATQQLSVINRSQIGIQKNIILAGSSFPQDPTENGEDETGTIILEEVRMFEECKKQYPSLIYGDYATINSEPNLRAGGNGWIPRIDFPTVDGKSVIYHRSRKGKIEKNYEAAYIRVAQKVSNNEQFKLLQKKLGNDNWGIQQIMFATEGYPPGLNPSFWISVRINLHVTLRRLLILEQT